MSGLPQLNLCQALRYVTRVPAVFSCVRRWNAVVEKAGVTSGDARVTIKI